MNLNFEHTAVNFGGSKIHSEGKSLGMISSLIPAGPGITFADLACGTGNLGNALLDKMRHVIFTDGSAAMLKIAAEKNGGAANTSFILADCHNLPFDNSSIDIAGSRFAFHHFQNPAAIFKEMRRILTPCGLFFLIDLTGHANAALSAINHDIELLHDETHIKSYTPDELCSLAENDGFYFTHAGSFLESDAGLTINEWCRLTDREANTPLICNHLHGLSPAQLLDLGYSENEAGFINHVKVAITIFKKK